MPIHLIWGDDSAARDRAIENLVKELVDPDWTSMNLSRIDGSDNGQINKVFDEMRTPPFGKGARVLLVQRNPFCNNCSAELSEKFINSIKLIPNNTYLILSNSIKPDGRLKSTKTLQQLIKTKEVIEKNFILPAIWDGIGQQKLVRETVKELGFSIEQEAVFKLIEAIGNDSDRLFSELQKIALLEDSKNKSKDIKTQKLLITSTTVSELIEGKTVNSFQIGDCLLEGKMGEALIKIEHLLNTGEPALRILASLTTQTRGWLWVSLLDKEGQKDVGFISKTAGIANPKRIYVIRKQIQGKPSSLFLNLLNRLLEIEAALKKGVSPSNAFKDNLISQL